MAVGVLLGKLVPSLTHTLRGIELGSQVNLPIAILIWLMITGAFRHAVYQLDREAVLNGPFSSDSSLPA